MENRIEKLDLTQLEKVTGGDNYKIGKMDAPLLDLLDDLVRRLFD